MVTYPAAPPTRNYDSLVGIYDLLATCWSGAAMENARMWCAERISADEQVVVVGPGTGVDAAYMTSSGAHLLLIDLSRKMLEASVGRCRSGGNSTPQQIHGDFRLQKMLEPQDTAVAPFFLNIFSAAEALQVLKHLRDSIHPNGRILISDFSAPPKNPIARLLMEIWHGIPMACFYLWTGNAWHGVHDISSLASQAGLEITRHKRFRILKWGPRWIEALELRKSEAT
ncbi:MAG: methyltransferase domain-containing protein [Planctomycetota bacterium]|nr:methyltransferase domain-containing protein [Planctomycetota bacterium]